MIRVDSGLEGMGNTVTSGFSVPMIVPLAERSSRGSVQEKLMHVFYGSERVRVRASEREPVRCREVMPVTLV